LRTSRETPRREADLNRVGAPAAVDRLGMQLPPRHRALQLEQNLRTRFSVGAAALLARTGITPGNPEHIAEITITAPMMKRTLTPEYSAASRLPADHVKRSAEASVGQHEIARRAEDRRDDDDQAGRKSSWSRSVRMSGGTE